MDTARDVSTRPHTPRLMNSARHVTRGLHIPRFLGKMDFCDVASTIIPSLEGGAVGGVLQVDRADEQILRVGRLQWVDQAGAEGGAVLRPGKLLSPMS
jgi:hypothetical protein